VREGGGPGVIKRKAHRRRSAEEEKKGGGGKRKGIGNVTLLGHRGEESPTSRKWRSQTFGEGGDARLV